MTRSTNEDDFIRGFEQSGTYKNNFSRVALIALHDYFTRLEEDLGEELDYDMVAICCDYSEFSSLEELQENYTDIKDIEDLQEHTTVIELENGGLIIQNY